ncbi:MULTISPECIES: riboflavin synthase [Caproicibacterium]|mgnify:CR=1 FL=1|jgi:riboflavin synthase|uniref:Riboflavin synthase n=1 Tax=Caproicibacterium lactatifermentans TaxID=2666138 RepID=A0A859DU12_9FIRM|nr:riboflavin synthase [Caproicibacterium lactatifermentans]ARP50536.1 riboflavin synthase [Ruminococcaceae bacterium CPB6]MDD4807823.1 riboflavin synthase [Oscillospiraceae bacterium]QKN23743.1 riboflavin synthase [Caproicibacterium lactatifermentans]QKO29622.1 riboflavin synthase [Caproicibacterium lactatifermentans]
MFTGIIEEVGTVQAIRQGAASASLTIRADKVLQGSHLGDSIAVNGVCLTVTALSPTTFTADAVHETMNRTSFHLLHHGSPVNLERAMAANGRFGGHLVTGHVDGTGTVTSVSRDDNAVWYTIRAGNELLRYIVEKGSITVDGISLTVANVTGTDFSISVIPFTTAHTTLQYLRRGSTVNLETDIIGKYTEKFLNLSPPNHSHKNIVYQDLKYRMED